MTAHRKPSASGQPKQVEK
jgi:hypothetical protein